MIVSKPTNAIQYNTIQIPAGEREYVYPACGLGIRFLCAAPIPKTTRWTLDLAGRLIMLTVGNEIDTAITRPRRGIRWALCARYLSDGLTYNACLDRRRLSLPTV